VILVPNGCDFELFNTAAERKLVVPPEVRDITAPIIGYYGSISSWFDIELIEQVADTFSHCQVVIIGPGSDKVNRSGRHNILSLGYKSYSDLPHYAQLFDVALIPFRVSPLTEAVNPVKMWEYLAAGLPVVSSALPEVRGITEVYCSESKADFMDNIARALYEDTEEMKRERIELARKNTWMARAETILGAIQTRVYRKHTMNTNLSSPSGYPDNNAGNSRFSSMTVKNIVINQGSRDRVLKYQN
ncbi:MAG: glycosyltransferase, partial [Ignavibacteriales bacterium]